MFFGDAATPLWIIYLLHANIFRHQIFEVKWSHLTKQSVRITPRVTDPCIFLHMRYKQEVLSYLSVWSFAVILASQILLHTRYRDDHPQQEYREAYT